MKQGHWVMMMLMCAQAAVVTAACTPVSQVTRVSGDAPYRRPERRVDPATIDVAHPAFGDAAQALEPAQAYAFFDGATGATLTFEDVTARALQAEVVVLGEQHDQASHHELQRLMVGALAQAAPGLVVGLEMLTWPLQPALDRYNAGELDTSGLAAEVDWPKAWGFPFALYEGIFTTGRSAGARFVALNAPRELVKAVRKKGIDGLSRDELSALPDIDLGDTLHRDWFRGVFGQAGHPMSAADIDGFYTAQVVWDESMAERTVEALASGASKVVVLVGAGHVARGRGIPQRVERRRPGARVLSVVPITDVDSENVRARVREAVVLGEGDVLVVPRFEQVLSL